MAHARITGVGSYLPETILSNEDLEAMVETSHEWIVTRTGIRERRLAHPDEATSDLAAEAARRALADASITPGDLDLIVVGTSSPDKIFPSTACLVAAKIGARCPALDAMAACTSFVYALHHATSAIESGRAARVLVVGADALTRHVDFTDRATCVLFGDGAGAFVVEAGDEPGVLGIDLGADGTRADVLEIPACGSAMPASEEVLANRLQFIKMNGQEVFKFAVRVIPESVRRALAASGMTTEDLDWLVPHQANQRILDTVADRLGVAHERVFSNIATTGNTSAASIPLAVDALYTGRNLHPGSVVALVGFGAGLTWGSVIVRWTKEAR
ncbi:beta-ketoacyl-ACP synthase III [Coriobacteriaceae bacterium EMTCatB1]|nr:beta-ketoacyl-ACP synthase III [Coriobacteriaceae bacterium EMTCatB1]